ncbi:hypothetical protein P22_3118 [Propionispora sp. 2/2-37]|uniref:non-homologous end-joining DNA ligase n=1 Tax=Propionispora sp. 2/2-37 TaxID=1677858 RepID=UPI0006BB7E7F|nr:non-homologous end-joining DNA ligase [Propionispora sp. 2/2-37]CUH96992.1 hypothetical protein P22_3118 [Propionispora sp. 2/2-37]
MRLLQPMLAKLSSSLPLNDADYGFEVKWDGMRTMLYLNNNKFSLLTRNRHDVTPLYPELAPFEELFQAHKITQIILDGEIVSLDAAGRPSFSTLQKRFGLTLNKVRNMMTEAPATYIIFDVLYLNGQYFLDKTYVERRNILENLQLTSPFCQVPAYQTGSGNAMLLATKKLGLEGIIAKRLDSLYYPGQKTGDWLKIKNTLRQEFIIGGWQQGKGSRNTSFGALLLGYYDMTAKQARIHDISQKLFYAGKVGTGFNAASLNQLTQLLKPLRCESGFFINPPRMKDIVFVYPKLIIECEFTEWTANQTLRHPSFKGLRFDKPALDVVRET